MAFRQAVLFSVIMKGKKQRIIYIWSQKHATDVEQRCEGSVDCIMILN